MRSYAEVHVKVCIKGHVVIIHGITCASNGSIDDSVTYGTEIC